MKLPKSARLHHRTLQEKLFQEGEKIHEYPLRMIWRSLTREQLNGCFRDKVPDLIGPLQVLVSVPKKKRRKAVDRVLIRRRIREAFRISRGEMLALVESTPQIRTVSVGFVYMKEGNTSFSDIKEKMEKLLKKAGDKIKERYEVSDSSDDNAG